MMAIDQALKATTQTSAPESIATAEGWEEKVAALVCGSLSKRKKLSPKSEEHQPAQDVNDIEGEIETGKGTGPNVTGHWTPAEHAKFLEALQKFGLNWKKVRAWVGTRSASQIRSHAQKHFLKFPKEAEITEDSQPPSPLLPPSQSANQPVPKTAPQAIRSTLSTIRAELRPGSLKRQIGTSLAPTPQSQNQSSETPFKLLEIYLTSAETRLKASIDIYRGSQVRLVQLRDELLIILQALTKMSASYVMPALKHDPVVEGRLAYNRWLALVIRAKCGIKTINQSLPHLAPGTAMPCKYLQEFMAQHNQVVGLYAIRRACPRLEDYLISDSHSAPSPINPR